MVFINNVVHLLTVSSGFCVICCPILNVSFIKRQSRHQSSRLRGAKRLSGAAKVWNNWPNYALKPKSAG